MPCSASNFASISFHHGSESARTPSRSKITARSTEYETTRLRTTGPRLAAPRYRYLLSGRLSFKRCRFQSSGESAINCHQSVINGPLSVVRGQGLREAEMEDGK